MKIFEIGDTIYVARTGRSQVARTCPECLGSGRLRVILGDESEVSIFCECCKQDGYADCWRQQSCGQQMVWEFVAKAEPIIVAGVEVKTTADETEVTYRYNWSECGGNLCYGKDAFATKEEALARATEIKAEHEADELQRLGRKEKQHQTWARNVAYHRQCIRKAQKDLDYHAAKLNAVPNNRKELDKQEVA